MKHIALILIIISIVGCSTGTKKSASVHFFQGKASDECEFMGYIESESQKDTEEESIESCKEDLFAQSNKYRSNALKIINVNRILTKINISAEAYRCKSLMQLKLADDTSVNFDF